MRIVNIHETKTHLSNLIQEVLRGEELVIAKGHEPLIRLEIFKKKKKRIIGLYKNKIKIGEDFDSELRDFDEYQKRIFAGYTRVALDGKWRQSAKQDLESSIG